jgi:hypothetical protein
VDGKGSDENLAEVQQKPLIVKLNLKKKPTQAKKPTKKKVDTNLSAETTKKKGEKNNIYLPVEKKRRSARKNS